MDNNLHALFSKLEELMLSLIARLSDKMHEHDIAFARELVQAGEYGVAIEHLCSALYEDDIAIDPGVFDMIEHIANLMGMHPDAYVFTRNLVREER